MCIPDEDDKFSVILVEVAAFRRSSYHVYNMMLPVFLITICCSTVIAVPPNTNSGAGNRLAITLTLLLTTIACKITATNTLPQLGYLTYMDRFIMTNFCFLVLVAFENLFIALALTDWLAWPDASQTSIQTNQTNNQTTNSGDDDEWIHTLDHWGLLLIGVFYVITMLGFVCRAKYLNTIKLTPDQTRSLEIREADIKFREAKDAMKEATSDRCEKAMGKLFDTTKKLKELKDIHKRKASEERKGKKEIKDIKSKFKKAVHAFKKAVDDGLTHIKKAVDDGSTPAMEKIVCQIDWETLKATECEKHKQRLDELSNELTKAVKDFEKLDDSEVPETWSSFLLYGWWSGRTFRKIYQGQSMHSNNVSAFK